MRGKGQTFMPDYLASLLVFAVILAIFIGMWDLMVVNQQKFEGSDNMRSQAIYTTTFLVATPGYPDNWEEPSESPTIVGFAQEDHVLDDDKLQAFRSLSYDEQRRLLQVENYQLSVYNSTDNLSLGGSELVFGDSFENAETVVPVERNVLLNKSGKLRDAKLGLAIWS